MGVCIASLSHGAIGRSTVSGVNISSYSLNVFNDAVIQMLRVSVFSSLICLYVIAANALSHIIK